MTFDVTRRDDAIDPQEERAARPASRWWPHLVWDGTLLIVTLIAAATVLLFLPEFPDLTEDGPVSTAVMLFSPLLLLATALAVSMRVGVANIAVVGIAVLAPMVHSISTGAGLDVGMAWLVTVGVVVGIGLVQSVLALLLRASGWIVGLLTLIAVGAALTHLDRVGMTWSTVEVWDIGLLDTVGIISISAAVVGIAILVGAVASLRPIRAVSERATSAADGTGRRGVAVTALTIGALIMSALLAAAAGLLAPQLSTGAISTDPLSAANLNLLLVVVGVVLFGGTTTRGTGGVVGVVFAAMLVVALAAYLKTAQPEQAWIWMSTGVVLLGLVVNVCLIALGRARAVPTEPDTPLSTLMDDATATSVMPAAVEPATLVQPVVPTEPVTAASPAIPGSDAPTEVVPVVAEPATAPDLTVSEAPTPDVPSSPERGEDPLPAMPDSTVTLAPVGAFGPLGTETPHGAGASDDVDPVPHTPTVEEPRDVERAPTEPTASEPVVPEPIDPPTVAPTPTAEEAPEPATVDAPSADETPAVEEVSSTATTQPIPVVEDTDTVVIRPRKETDAPTP